MRFFLVIALSLVIKVLAGTVVYASFGLKAFDYAEKFKNQIIGSTALLIQMIKPLNSFLDDFNANQFICNDKLVVPEWVGKVKDILKTGSYTENESDEYLEFLCSGFIWTIVNFYSNFKKPVLVHDFGNQGYHVELDNYSISYVEDEYNFPFETFVDQEIIAVINDDMTSFKFKRDSKWFEYDGVSKLTEITGDEDDDDIPLKNFVISISKN